MSFIDPRTSFRFYNASLLCWVTGNFIWMTIEFTNIESSSQVHTGPHVPIGGITDEQAAVMTKVKTALFATGVIIQLSMYLCIALGVVPMPEYEEEDTIVRNEVIWFIMGKKSYSATGDSDNIVDLTDDFSESSYNETTVKKIITLAFIENAYIIFWISKDTFWSLGTGDLPHGKPFAIAIETLAICFGATALAVYLVTSFLYRRNPLRLLDSITTVLWICANFVWMCGEFFIRYDNLNHDDSTSGNDGDTRIASATLFCMGISLQLFVIVNMLCYDCRTNCISSGSNYNANWSVVKQRASSLSSVNSSDSSNHGSGSSNNDDDSGGVATSSSSQVEMISIATSKKLQHLMIAFSPFTPQYSESGSAKSNNHHNAVRLALDEEESTVLF